MKLIDGQTNPTYATYAKDGMVTVRVTASGNTEEEASELVRYGADQVAKLIGDDIYSFDDEEPEEALVRMLKERSMTIAFAESLTGGMIAQKLTSVPGASAAVAGGVVSYTDAVKHKLLGVKQKTLAEHTAVSGQCCREMAEGIRAAVVSDIGVAVTGYAGPQVADEKVGQVFIGVAAAGFTYVKEFSFNGSRDRIRTLTAVNAIDLTRRIMQDPRRFEDCGQ